MKLSQRTSQHIRLTVLINKIVEKEKSCAPQNPFYKLNRKVTSVVEDGENLCSFTDIVSHGFSVQAALVKFLCASIIVRPNGERQTWCTAKDVRIGIVSYERQIRRATCLDTRGAEKVLTNNQMRLATEGHVQMLLTTSYQTDDENRSTETTFHPKNFTYTLWVC